jgi:hypothetical protein
MAYRLTTTTSVPRGTAGRVAVPRWLFQSPIWFQASLDAKACFVQIASLFDGENNGKIEFRVREAQRLGLTRSRASAAFDSLQELGLAVNINAGRNKVATWRLPHLHCDATGEKAVKNWSREWVWTQQEVVDVLRASNYLSEHYVDPGEDWFPGMPTRGDLWYARDCIIHEGINESYDLTDERKEALIEISKGQGVFETWMLYFARQNFEEPSKGFIDRVRTAQARPPSAPTPRDARYAARHERHSGRRVAESADIAF